ncbi:MAG: hypothetical protein RML37_12515 [Chitinophagales bacterium]|nr:hypothetical protein [Chitinophagales bacterium]
MARAYSVNEIISTRYELITWGAEWESAFGRPEASGLWFVWGNSGNAKTRFLIELAKELSKYYSVFYNSLEEGKRQTMKNMLLSAGVDTGNRRLLIGQEPLNELDERLRKRRAPHVAIIDSVQYANTRFDMLLKLLHEHPSRLFIISSHADGKKPEGRTANRLLYHADLKIQVEGYKATSNGRYNPGGQYTIWQQGAANYWGTDITKTQNDAHEN